MAKRRRNGISTGGKAPDPRKLNSLLTHFKGRDLLKLAKSFDPHDRTWLLATIRQWNKELDAPLEGHVVNWEPFKKNLRSRLGEETTKRLLPHLSCGIYGLQVFITVLENCLGKPPRCTTTRHTASAKSARQSRRVLGLPPDLS
ncbi:hypothetical protein GQ53DRAFT_184475 [Thozetella sp. PMI_491]|nr:hypothetical protein GQ53DRAFT_184475 [Thozetella sp. PMI_491]